MRRIILLIVAFVGLAVVFAAPASATSPHFINSSAALSGQNLVVSWKEAGLGANVLIDYTATANASKTDVCVNGGNHNPSAANKTTVQGPVSSSGAFASGKNGNIVGSLTLEPPASPNFCPPGQSQQTALVTYTDVSITDVTNGITDPIPGTFTTGCLLLDVTGACD